MSAWLCPDVCGSRESSEHSGRNTRNDRRVPCDSADGMPLHDAPPGLRERRSIRRPLSVTSATLSVKRYGRAFAAMETRLYADLSGAFTPLANAAKMTADNMLNMVDATATRSPTIAACPRSALVVRP